MPRSSHIGAGEPLSRQPQWGPPLCAHLTVSRKVGCNWRTRAPFHWSPPSALNRESLERGTLAWASGAGGALPQGEEGVAEELARQSCALPPTSCHEAIERVGMAVTERFHEVRERLNRTRPQTWALQVREIALQRQTQSSP